MKKVIKKLWGKFWDKFGPLYVKLIDDNIFAVAGQSAFFLILSVVPLMMFAVSILQGLHIPVEIIEQSLNTVLNQKTSEWLARYLNNMYNSTVGISIITIFFTLWSAAQGIHALTNGMNRVYNTYENRNWFLLRFRAMFYTVVLFAIFLVTMIVIVFGNSINELIKPHLIYTSDFVSNLYRARFFIVFFYLMFLFALVYRNLPNISRQKRKKYGIRCQLPGAFFAAASWFVLAWAIGIYVDDFNGYSIYGGLTRVAVVMVWLYFCMVCLMLGAEINYVYHEYIDRTTGKFLRRRK